MKTWEKAEHAIQEIIDKGLCMHIERLNDNIIEACILDYNQIVLHVARTTNPKAPFNAIIKVHELWLKETR